MDGHRRRVVRSGWQENPDHLTVMVDADFAGCQRARKSNAGGCILFGRNCFKAWSKTLPVLALSTGEAELGAVVKGTAEGKGMQTPMADVGVRCDIQTHSDATVAIGIVGRLGIGKSDTWPLPTYGSNTRCAEKKCRTEKQVVQSPPRT